MNKYYVDKLGKESYSIVTDYGTPVLILIRTSLKQAKAVAQALNEAYKQGSEGPRGFQEGYDHGYSNGYDVGSEENYDAGYDAGRADYRAELMERPKFSASQIFSDALNRSFNR